MKLIIRYCLQWGNFTTQAINIEEDADVSALQAKIKERFDVTESQQVLKFKKDGITVKLVEGFPLTHFGVKEKSIVFLEKAEAQVEEEEIKQDNYVNKGGYFAKLGIMGKIDEDEEDEGNGNPQNLKGKINSWSYSGSQSGSDGLIDAQVSSDEEGTDVTKDAAGKAAKYARLGDQSKALLKEVKDSNLEKVKEIFNSFEEKNKEQQIRKVIDQLTETGWNLMHWACYGGHAQIVKLFLDHDANLNIETNDGWTSLQLAAFKNHIEVVKILLAKKIMDINQITSKGTALHVAAKNAKPEMVSLLLENKADPELRDEQNALPLEVASNDKIIELIQTAIKKRTEDKFKPPKPPVVKGFMYKRGTYFGKMNQRFMVLNPDEGTLIRYKYKEDYPNKPKEIIPLKSIEGARRMKAGPLYDKTFHYVQVLYQKRYIYACHNEETANQWVKYIIQGVVYANYVEGKLQKQEKKKTGKETPKEAYNYFDEPSEEIVIDDPVPASKLGSKNGQKEDQLKDGQVNFNSFEVLSILGSGAFGRVFRVVKKGSDKVYAMKALKKHNLIVKNQLRYAVTEANVLKMASHPFVLQLHYAFQTPQHLYLVLDLCPGGDLSLHLANKGVFTEDEVRFYLAELILAVEHIHSLDVIYRDLKPENILLDEEGHIKLADFGLAKENIGKDDVARSFCGSPAYLSPEMVKRRGVGKSADLYGIGTVMYELLTGEAPYYNDEIPKLYQNIARAKLDIPNNLSMEARDLITRLLDRDPEQRLGARDRNELRNHPFFAGIDWEKLERKELTPPKLDALAADDIEMPLSSKIKDSDYTEKNKKINRVKNYTFVRDKPEIDPELES